MAAKDDKPTEAAENLESLKDTHYADVAAHYDEHVFYDIEGPLVKWQLDVLYKKLHLRPGLHLVDIGGGTGGFTHELAKKLVAAGDKTPSVTLVEPAEEMLKKAKERTEPSLGLLLGDAFTFCDKPAAVGGSDNSGYKQHAAPQMEKTKTEGSVPVDGAGSGAVASCDRILLKEVVHHIPEADRDETFRRLYERLPPGGRIVIVTRPSVLTDYPFPEFFLKYWAENQPNLESNEGLLRRAGFEVESECCPFPLRIKRLVWYRMLNQRFWSWLTFFADEKIRSGIEELDSRYPVGDEGPEAASADFCFNELMLCIVGTKPM